MINMIKKEYVEDTLLLATWVLAWNSRWAARLLSILVLGIYLAYFINHIRHYDPFNNPIQSSYDLNCFAFNSIFIGHLIAWGWEFYGALISITGLVVIYYLKDYLLDPVVIFSFPAFGFLLSSLFNQAHKRITNNSNRTVKCNIPHHRC